MTKYDELLIEQARSKPWEEIDSSIAETEEGRQALHDLAVEKYLYEEASCGLI